MDMAKKILEDNYMFSETLYIDTYEERKYEDEDTSLLSCSFVTTPIPNIISLLSNIATIIDFILKYFQNNTKGKIIIKKGDVEITIDGNYSKDKLEKILNSFTEIATEENIIQYIEIKRHIIKQEISQLDRNIQNYKEFYEIIPKRQKERAEKYAIRINYWNERKKFLFTLLQELENVIIDK